MCIYVKLYINRMYCYFNRFEHSQGGTWLYLIFSAFLTFLIGVFDLFNDLGNFIAFFYFDPASQNCKKNYN